MYCDVTLCCQARKVPRSRLRARDTGRGTILVLKKENHKNFMSFPQRVLRVINVKLKKSHDMSFIG